MVCYSESHEILKSWLYRMLLIIHLQMSLYQKMIEITLPNCHLALLYPRATTYNM